MVIAYASTLPAKSRITPETGFQQIGVDLEPVLQQLKVSRLISGDFVEKREFMFNEVRLAIDFSPSN